MKAKKPVLVAAVVLALLAVALIVPAVASGKSDNKPVSWAKGSYNSNNTELPDSHWGATVNVQLLADGTLKGQVVQKIIRTSDPEFADAPTARVAKLFTDQLPWPLFFGPLAHAEFTPVGDLSYEWPEELTSDPWDGWPGVEEPLRYLNGDYAQASIADLVYYLQTPFPDLVETFPTWPHRFVVIDFGEPGREDLVQIYAWGPLGDPYDPFTPWVWIPQRLAPELYDGVNYGLGDPIPIPNGNFQVHVGETDG